MPISKLCLLKRPYIEIIDIAIIKYAVCNIYHGSATKVTLA